MAVKIGSARSNERGSITNGKPGDQKSGKEVSTQSWYLHTKGWVVLRLRDPEKREKAAWAMQAACDNDHFGYGQDDRLTGYNAAKKVGFNPAKVKENVNIDCSELVRLCLAYAGITVPDWYTGSMKTICKGMPEIFEVIEGTRAQKSDYLLRGDILVTKTKGHTVIVLSDGEKANPGKVYPDISHYETVSDWDALKAAAPFLITKATQGMGNTDATLDTVIKGCEKYHIPYWLYVLLDKGNELDQTKRLVNVCEKKIGEYFRGYCIDVEKANDPADVGRALKWLADRGERCMIYTAFKDYGMYKSIIDSRPDTVAWWEARYGKNDGVYSYKYPPHDGVDLHQFTEVGYCPGILNDTDLNRLTGKKQREWFTDKVEEPDDFIKKKYSGEFPKLPDRGYYMMNDGITRLTSMRSEIEKVQKLVNWINGGHIAVDGQYGKNTVAAVKLAQTNLRVDCDGEFGRITLGAAKEYQR